MHSTYRVVVIDKDNPEKREIFTLTASSWSSAAMKAHTMIQDRKQREEFKTNYILKALVIIT